MSNGLKLGISKIGDLLIEEKITQCQDEHLKEQTISLKIPAYQRPYKWTAKNANQLLDDILEAKSSNKDKYRVGTLILHYDGKEYNIVDGQQRIITFSLLLYALDDKEQIPFMNQQLSCSSYNFHNVLNNYLSLKRRLSHFNSDSKENSEVLDYVKEHCELIIVITDDQTEAFQFFDSQNARGKALYPHDLLKAYHLREMRSLDVRSTEQIVKMWEELDQKQLAELFNSYLYRLKEWMNGSMSDVLSEKNIELFKGVTSRDNYPYAQYYKGAYAYADDVNHSHLPFVTGVNEMNPFQLNAPIIAGKPFFEYAKHYYDILADIQNNDKYEGYFINDNEIVRTLDLPIYKKNKGDRIVRKMFDIAILLYVDRFCPCIPSEEDLEMLDKFVEFAFIWAYSLRAQYIKLGWLSAQNYILNTGAGKSGVVNSFNIYKAIIQADSPRTLLNRLSDNIVHLNDSKVYANKDNVDAVDDEDGRIHLNYLHFFKKYNYWEPKNVQ